MLPVVPKREGARCEIMNMKTSTAVRALLIHDPAPSPPPLAVTVNKACELCSLGPTTVWSLIRDGRLEIVRVAGIRRTLILYDSLRKLLTPETAQQPKRRRGRPPKVRAPEAAT
jgi:hypothetical protein